MKAIKTMIPIGVVILFLGLAFTPTVSAETFSDKDKTLEIGYKTSEGNIFYEKLVVTDEQLTAFNDIWTNWENFVEQVRADQKMGIEELIQFELKTIEFIQNIKEMTYNPDTGEYLFPEFDIEKFIQTYLLTKNDNSRALLGSKLFSIGRGRVWIPFNRQGESFIGMRFLPISVRHSLGYSKVRKVTLIPPSIGVQDRLFVHRCFTFGFVGLYINFGERYLDRSAGPVFLIGRTLGLRLGEDLP